MNTHPFDRGSAIAASIVLAVVGWAVFMGLPILVGALVDTRGFTEAQVGYIASADLGGMFISSIIVSLFVARMDRRRWATIGILIAIAADVFAIYSHDIRSMLTIRVIAGLGAGFCYSIALANLAASSDTARNFSYLVFALVTVNFFELYSLKIISTHWGVTGIFVTFILLNALILLTWPFLPRDRHADTQLRSLSEAGNPPSARQPSGGLEPGNSRFNLPLLGSLCLVAIASFYLMIGGFWAYIERMGVAAGFDDDFIAASLSATTLLSVLGCYIAYRIARQQGQSRPLIVAPLGIAIVLLWLGVHTVATTFVTVLLVYQLLWNGVDIFQLGTLSNIDHSGRFVALVPAAQGLGQTLGPSLAGFLISLDLGYSAVMTLCAAAAVTTSLIYACVYGNLRRRAPELADAR